MTSPAQHEARRLDWWRRASALSGGAVALVGGLVMLGWAAGVPALRSVRPGLVTMKPNTAACFVLCGLALAALATPPTAWARAVRRLVPALGGVAGLVGLVTLLEYTTGRGLGIDGLLFKESADAIASSPAGRMAPATALGFVLAGASLWLLLRSHVRMAQACAIAFGGIGLVALVGYSYGAEILYGFRSTTRVAVHTAAAFFLLAMGVLIGSAPRGLMGVVASETSGGLILRWLLPPAILGPLVLGGLRLVGQRFGYYETEFGLSLVIISTIVLPTGVTAGLARRLYDLENERNLAEKALEAKAEELARSNTELEQFAYSASHDLQEPLRMVASYVQLLERRYRGKLDADADEFIGYAVDGSKRMQDMIQAVLAYSRVARTTGLLETTSLTQTLDHARANLAAAIGESGARVEQDGELPAVRADPQQLVQLFQNLVSNAIKFRGERPVEVRIGAARAGGDWVVRVSDNGIGIESKYFERIFQVFQRLHTRKEFPGTGVGLAICKRIVERHGGRIWVESHPDQGATFSFTIPAVEEPNA